MMNAGGATAPMQLLFVTATISQPQETTVQVRRQEVPSQAEEEEEENDLDKAEEGESERGQVSRSVICSPNQIRARQKGRSIR